jgi:hypothetical protein
VQPVILDTDVASLSHKRKLTGPLATRLIGRKPLITLVTFGELTKWTEIRHWDTRSSAWLTATAKRKALDVLRRGRVFRSKMPPLVEPDEGGARWVVELDPVIGNRPEDHVEVRAE